MRMLLPASLVLPFPKNIVEEAEAVLVVGEYRLLEASDADLERLVVPVLGEEPEPSEEEVVGEERLEGRVALLCGGVGNL